MIERRNLKGAPFRKTDVTFAGGFFYPVKKTQKYIYE